LELSKTLNQSGTIKYAAPEIYQGDFGKKSDIFSLGKSSCFIQGILFYEIIVLKNDYVFATEMLINKNFFSEIIEKLKKSIFVDLILQMIKGISFHQF
jgi:serine/threonine protein kinase